MAVAGYTSQIYLTSSPALSFTNEATTASADRKIYSITNQVKRLLDEATAVVVQKANDELQSVTINGSPTGGDFTLTFGGDTTAAIAFNAAASLVQTRLQALASIGVGNALVTGAAGGPWQVQFTSTLGLANQAALTANPAGLTGGTSPNVAIAEVQPGGAFATISIGFTLRHVGGKVIFPTAQPVGTQIRLASGKYLPYLAVAGAHSVEFTAKVNYEECTIFDENGLGFKIYELTTMEGEAKSENFWADHTRINNLIDRDKLVVSILLPTGRRVEGSIFVGECTIKSEVGGLVMEELSLQLTDQFFSQV